ncbi:MAG: sulfur carrier protein ThiS [Burkholderiales bacterium]|nr:sulfur carrier protein ThiS [Burkholderiales bacterium]
MIEAVEKVAFQLNGQAHSLALGASLQDLMCELELENQALALAVNRQVIPRQRWAEYVLQAGDQIDIVRAIGGG